MNLLDLEVKGQVHKVKKALENFEGHAFKRNSHVQPLQ